MAWSALFIAVGAWLVCGCTQAFIEVRQDRTLYHPPDTVLSVGARWYFWDAYGDWLAGKVKEAAR